MAALAHDNYVAFRRAKDAVDGYRARLMDCADDDMRMVTLKCFGSAYMSVDLPFLERCTGKEWMVLKDVGLGWELQGGSKVIIRKINRK